MDIQHEESGDMIIVLDAADVQFLRTEGFCIGYIGLMGRETKTWVRTDQPTDRPRALIDGASDVYVHLPLGDEDNLPQIVKNADIDPYMDVDRGRVDWFFGKSGGIIVRLAGSESVQTTS